MRFIKNTLLFLFISMTPLTAWSYCEGDFDHDLDVDVSDIEAFASKFGCTNCDSSPQAVFITDGDFDGMDLAALVKEFGNTNCPKGVLLQGDPNLLALDAIYNFSSGYPVNDAEVTYFTSGGNVVRTQLGISFAVTANVGEINDMLNTFNAVITGMRAGVNWLIVQIPDPGDLVGLENVIASVNAEAVVDFVVKAHMPTIEGLPDNIAPQTADINTIDNLLAIRSHAAWNAIEALRDPVVETQKPVVIIADYFGGGPSPSMDDFNLEVIQPLDFTPTAIGEHGYKVMSVMSAAFGGDNTDRGRVTGISPLTLPVRIVDLHHNLTNMQYNQLIVDHIRNSNVTRAVINTSLGTNCFDSSKNKIPCDRTEIEPDAVAWINQVRGISSAAPSVEGKFIHLSAAGNKQPNEDYNAILNSEYNAAAWLDNIMNPASGAPVTNLTNTLVVENRKISTAGEPFRPGCLYTGDPPPDYASKHPGDLSAVGTDVWMLAGPDATDPAVNDTGTSFATPAVAGLAAMVWALKPDYTPQELAQLLQDTSWSPDSDSTCLNYPAPSVDAYAALLATDDGSAITGTADPSMAKVRLVVLDVADGSGNLGTNQKFDEHDIQRYLDAFAAAPADPDYSRYDLNGDGYTGGDSTSRMDLNANYSLQTGLNIENNITQEIEGYTSNYDENKITDLEALCYYSYSSLFDSNGDKEVRDSLLGYRNCISLFAKWPTKVCITGPCTMNCFEDSCIDWDEKQLLPVHLEDQSSPYGNISMDIDGSLEQITISLDPSLTDIAIGSASATATIQYTSPKDGTLRLAFEPTWITNPSCAYIYRKVGIDELTGPNWAELKCLVYPGRPPECWIRTPDQPDPNTFPGGNFIDVPVNNQQKWDIRYDLSISNGLGWPDPPCSVPPDCSGTSLSITLN